MAGVNLVAPEPFSFNNPEIRPQYSNTQTKVTTNLCVGVEQWLDTIFDREEPEFQSDDRDVPRSRSLLLKS